MTNATFVHLKVHSEYAIVDSLLRIDSLLKKAVEFQMPAIALVDEMNLFAFIKFYKKAIQLGIKPIIGADLWVKEKDEIFRVSALCKNKKGYHNLILLISRAYLAIKENGRALIELDWLTELSEGLIILSGGCHGNIGRALLQGKTALAEKRLLHWLTYFPNHFYLELQRARRENEETAIALTLPLAVAHQVPVVATLDVRFLQPEDFEAHEARVCIQRGQTLEDPTRSRDYSDQQYLKSSDEMAALFSDIPEALANTVEIAKRCTLALTLGEVFLPNFPVPEDTSLENYFMTEAKKGLCERLSTPSDKCTSPPEAYMARLESELAVIIKMGFAGYFLIVADFISWAKAAHIPVGPGRGSGAGSLVAYSLGITALDPLQHELIFERFLNPERISLPDFDIDFCMEGRDRVIDYVANRYGHASVAQIITYGTMAARAVVRDVGRVLGLPYGFVDKVAKLIPFELGVTLEKALLQEELKRRYAAEEEVRTLIDLAKKLEGLTRNAGKHAGGVVIAPTKLTDFVPLYCEQDSEHVITQYDKDDIETVGLVKFDFLGLRTLTIIDWAVQNINKKCVKENVSPLVIADIPLDDIATYQLLKSCATTAVFQLESRGMKDLIRRLKPDNFDEIRALVALFRPGPLQSGMTDTFIACKQGQSPVHYPHPDLQPILRPTYGVILYQEQVMQIAQALAGYSLGGADILRSAMGKKKPQEMAKQRIVFTEGAKKRGIESRLAEHIFDLMEKFSGYGFNKSHAAAYAMLTYQTAWLKAHYPAEFMAAVLSSDMDNTDKVVGFISECREMKLQILAPNINRGAYHFTVNEAGQIEYGLGAIKGVGQSVVEHIVQCREKEGLFKNLFDLCQRVDLHKVTRRALEPLIRSGACDSFELSRAKLMASLEQALQAAEQMHRNSSFGQNDLFNLSTEKNSTLASIDHVLEWDDEERLRGEKETLGLYLTGHPLQACEKELSAFVTPIYRLQIAKNAIVIAGMMIGRRLITTRTGKRMAVVTLEDQTGRLDITLFQSLYDTIAADLTESAILIVRGSVAPDEFTGGVRMLAESVLTLDKMREQMAKRLCIYLNDARSSESVLQALPTLMTPHRGGRCPVMIAYRAESTRAELALGEAWRIKPNAVLLAELHTLCGLDNVVLEY